MRMHFRHVPPMHEHTTKAVVVIVMSRFTDMPIKLRSAPVPEADKQIDQGERLRWLSSMPQVGINSLHR